MARIRDFLSRVRGVHLGPVGLDWEAAKATPTPDIVPKQTYRPLPEVLAEQTQILAESGEPDGLHQDEFSRFVAYEMRIAVPQVSEISDRLLGRSGDLHTQVLLQSHACALESD